MVGQEEGIDGEVDREMLDCLKRWCLGLGHF